MWEWLKLVWGAETLFLDKERKPKRARTKRGRYKGDKKSTKNYNEAWVGGKAPKRKKSINFFNKIPIKKSK